MPDTDNMLSRTLGRLRPIRNATPEEIASQRAHASVPHVIPQSRLFYLYRIADATGVSGTGKVAEGIQWPDGKVSLRWLVGDHRSVTVWDSIDAARKIHGHDGKTLIIFADDRSHHRDTYVIRDMLHKLMQRASDTAIEKGWWDDDTRTIGDIIALIHSEASEALEEFRNGIPLDAIYYNDPDDGQVPYTEDAILDERKPEGFGVEMADILIRIFDTCHHYDIPLAQALEWKMAYNQTRPYRHGGKAI